MTRLEDIETAIARLSAEGWQGCVLGSKNSKAASLTT
jgi:hypothetical protein